MNEQSKTVVVDMGDYDIYLDLIDGTVDFVDYNPLYLIIVLWRCVCQDV